MINRKEASAAKPQPRRKAGFTAEAQSSQSFFIFKLLPPRPQRLGGEPSDSSDMALMSSR
jgi:hypothetical protein